MGSLLVLGGIGLTIATRPPAFEHLFPFDASTSPTFRPDPAYAYPYSPRTVPNWAAAVLAVGAPILVVVAAHRAAHLFRYYHSRCQHRRHQRCRSSFFWDAHAAILGVLTAVLAASVCQATLKWSVGGLRPHFYDRCRPDRGLALAIAAAAAGQKRDGGPGGRGYGGIMHTTAICGNPSADAAALRDAVTGFPSGHAASTFAGLGFLALWLNAKVKVLRPARLGPCSAGCFAVVLLLLPLLVATGICASLLADHSHHATDLVAGALVGVVSALVAYRARYAALWDPACNHVPLSYLDTYRYGSDERWEGLAFVDVG